MSLYVTLMAWEVAELVRQKTGLKLQTNDRTIAVVIEETSVFLNILYGPFTRGEETLMVSWTSVRGERTYMQLLVRDCEGDWLNSNALGAEDYNVGVIRVG